MLITLYKAGAGGRTLYYTIHNRQGNLFTPWSLSVVWGRSVSRGRERLIILESRVELDRKLRMLLRSRFAQGYKVLYSYFRADEHRYVAYEGDGAVEVAS